MQSQDAIVYTQRTSEVSLAESVGSRNRTDTLFCPCLLFIEFELKRSFLTFASLEMFKT
jgi:hypothetical protein